MYYIRFIASHVRLEVKIYKINKQRRSKSHTEQP